VWFDGSQISLRVYRGTANSIVIRLPRRHLQSVQRRPELAKSRSSLDIGCGPGLAAQVLSQTIANVAGIDASAAFIDIARQRLPGRNFRVGEMETLPHPDGSFDVVAGFNAFRYATSPVNALREARRVTRPDGAVVNWPGMVLEHSPLSGV
jgi:ubiquinone/menaquinone biosynthesis C-methylase UbiE